MKKIFVAATALATSLLAPATATAATACVQLERGNNNDIGLASMPGGPLDIYQTGLGGSVLRTQVDPRTNAVNSFQNLGGVSRSEPAAVSSADGHSAVVVRGGDDGLYAMQFDNGTTSGWQNLGGRITWNPHVVSLGPRHLIVFYRGTNKQLWYVEHANGVWGQHTSLGGVLTSSPIGVSTRPGHVAVVTRGQADDLYYIERTGSTWGPWTGLGGRFGVDPIAVSRGPGLVDVFVRTNSSRVAGISFNGSSWTPWYDLAAPPGSAVSEPGAAATGSGELVVFVRGGEVRTPVRPIWRNSSFDGGATWSGWVVVDSGYGTPSPNNPEAVANAFGGWSVAATNFPTDARVGPLRVCSSTP
ncbi:hypothetical protein [Kibdelosporangium phytohabitans]|uniref:PLL-like beta propeller domain-containing protein n=1 Tax=Kibdelosporangium phytohabitans TaxID=860235 RepID=A0A0N9I4L9_9PSEU|nr:hypothetical protein [Kibdelosporangium phytohabitans]ALG10571.1 hypothetical protein AOZ06_30025 [Kibdelosporangium phytohabitans]MBE1461676.1 hypothetical protein [Kibdelosporangium phytohabitans]